MENMQTGFSDSQTKEKRGPQERSRRRSKKFSPRDPVEGDMPQVVPTPNDLESALSILQAVYDQALEAGLLAKTHKTDVNGSPIFVLHLYGVRACDECRCWTMQAACPVCG